MNAIQTIKHDGDTWKVLSLGVEREDGTIMAHLASTTKGRQQKNGFYPIQRCEFIPAELVKH